MNQELLQKASPIKLLLMDVDGVLTDGTIYLVPGADGLVETKGFHSQDNLGLMWLHEFGIATGIISGRYSPALAEQAKLLSISYLYQKRLDKLNVWQEILDKSKLSPQQVAFVGDDFTDLPLITKAGLGVAVANARAEVKAAANFTTSASGGQGAVREVVELILKAQGLWDNVLDKYGSTQNHLNE